MYALSAASDAVIQHPMLELAPNAFVTLSREHTNHCWHFVGGDEEGLHSVAEGLTAAPAQPFAVPPRGALCTATAAHTAVCEA